MREYEFTFVVQPEISEEGLEGLCQKLESVLERTGATRLFYEDWGRRRLAYDIQKFQKGHYLVLHYLDGGGAVSEIERTARLEDSVLRYLTVLADEDVSDIEARKTEAVGLEEDRKRKAAERAAREAEEAAARAAEEAAARQAADEAAAAAETASESEGDEPPAEAAGESEGDEPPAEAASESEGDEPPAKAASAGAEAADDEERPA